MTCSPIRGTRLPRRRCRTSSCSCAAADVKDGYEFQQELIGHVRETEEARNTFSKAVKRMEDGKSAQPDAPEPQSCRQVRRCVCRTPLICVTATGSALSIVSPPTRSRLLDGQYWLAEASMPTITHRNERRGRAQINSNRSPNRRA